MSSPAYTDSDFAGALLNLMPPGKAWNRELDSIQAQAISCYAPTFRRSSDAAQALLVDGFPTTTVNLLSNWESTLGLPDSCAGDSPTLQARRAQVKARFTAAGDASINDYITYAASLGYTITVKQYTPMRMGQGTCGQQLGGVEWMFTWAVVTAANTITSFSVGSSLVGEPLASWGNTVLECELNEVAPAHTIVQFHYL